MKATLYHNPRCSKSRQALALLEENSVDFEIREYLKAPLEKEELKTIIGQLNIHAHDLLRTKESEYAEAGLSKSSSETEILSALVSYPKLLERPIVVTNKGARVGRPTESILEVL